MTAAVLRLEPVCDVACAQTCQYPAPSSASPEPATAVTLQITYGQNKGKGFTEEEDRFILCMVHKVRGPLRPTHYHPSVFRQSLPCSCSPLASARCLTGTRIGLSLMYTCCHIAQLGYGNWEDLKAEIRKSWRFR